MRPTEPSLRATRRRAPPRDGAGAPFGHAQDPRPPVALLGLLRPARGRRSRCRPRTGRSRARRRARPCSRGRASDGRGGRPGSSALRPRLRARAPSPARPRGRSGSPPAAAAPRAAAPPRAPVAQLAHHRLGHRQLHVWLSPSPRHHGALVLGRGAGHGQHAAPGVEHDHAGVQRPAGRARHRGQAGAGLDASETSSSASRNDAATGLAGLRPTRRAGRRSIGGGRLRRPRSAEPPAASAADAIRRSGRSSRRPPGRSRCRCRAAPRG